MTKLFSELILCLSPDHDTIISIKVWLIWLALLQISSKEVEKDYFQIVRTTGLREHVTLILYCINKTVKKRVCLFVY